MKIKVEMEWSLWIQIRSWVEGAKIEQVSEKNQNWKWSQECFPEWRHEISGLAYEHRPYDVFKKAIESGQKFSGSIRYGGAHSFDESKTGYFVTFYWGERYLYCGWLMWVDDPNKLLDVVEKRCRRYQMNVTQVRDFMKSLEFSLLSIESNPSQGTIFRIPKKSRIRDKGKVQDVH